MDAGAGRVHHLDELPRAFGDGFVRAGVLGPRVLHPEQVPLLVEHGLQVALPAVVQHEPPVGRLVADGRRPGGELAQQRDDGRPVEEAPERIGDQRRQPAGRVVTDAAPAAWIVVRRPGKLVDPRGHDDLVAGLHQRQQSGKLCLGFVDVHDGHRRLSSRRPRPTASLRVASGQSPTRGTTGASCPDQGRRRSLS